MALRWAQGLPVKVQISASLTNGTVQGYYVNFLSHNLPSVKLEK